MIVKTWENPIPLNAEEFHVFFDVHSSRSHIDPSLAVQGIMSSCPLHLAGAVECQKVRSDYVHHERDNGGSSNHVSKKPRGSSFISDSEIHREFAHHRPGVARINNGSFGSCPASVLSDQKKWRLRSLEQPDDFSTNELRKGLNDSRRVIQHLINADDVEEVSIVDNATTAAAIVLQQIHWGFFEGRFNREDSVLMFDCAFQSVKKSIQANITRAGGSVVEVHLPFPVKSNEDIISEFRKGLEIGKSNGRRVRLAIIDHITSMPCVVVPICELVKICREEGVDQVFVDAAHAIGSVPVDVKEIGADFYVSNLHKWFFCPHSAAFLYCRKTPISSDMHHPIVSHEYGNGLAVECSWTGTRDYSSYLVVPSILNFVNKFEGSLDGIMRRNHKAVVDMGEMLAKSWGTNLGSPPDMCASMIMVGLPSALGILSDSDALRLRLYLRDCKGIEVPVHYQPRVDGVDQHWDTNGGVVSAYVRISHQVYNTVEEYNRLKWAILKLIEDKSTCMVLLT